MSTPMISPAPSSTYGRLSAPRFEMNFDRVSGLIVLYAGHRQARVGEHEEGRKALLFPDFDNRRQETLQHSREPKTCVS